MDFFMCRKKETSSPTDTEPVLDGSPSPSNKHNYLTIPELQLDGSGDMCPKDETKSLRSDQSIDMERQGSLYSYPCEGEECMGFRNDFSAEGASAELQSFYKKVVGGNVHVGDSDCKTHLLERLAGGSFGEVYIGELASEAKKVAVKVEQQGKYNFVLQEGNVYRNLEGGPGIPHIYWYGYHGPQFGALVMDLLGPTLEHIFTMCKRKLSLKSVLMLADQMLESLDFIHGKSYVHRDISPSNFMLGIEGDAHRIYLIDFGHAKKYNTAFKMVMKRNSSLNSLPRAVVGTPRFISVHAHLSHEDGPRDDLESLGYILLYLLSGSLPWQGIRAQNMPEKLNKIAEQKLNIPIETLCKDLPEEFSTFFNYVRGLKLYGTPDYEGIKTLFKQLAKRKKMTYDKFDWEVEGTDMPVKVMESEAVPIGIPERLTSTGESPNTTPPSR